MKKEMATETERKFLVKGEFIQYAVKQMHIVQRYIFIDSVKTARVRICDDKAYLTIKGRPAAGSISRDEWEYNIPVSDAEDLMKICNPGIIDKTRYIIPSGNRHFEVDVFHGKNKGLIIAEIELSDENEEFGKPEWLGEEVTGNPAYYNANLIK
jgi:adenylate cyclase